eukprot:TRINITY_DN15827_c1_g1_i10.p3 TRINITY_DN15827_c1_g1~~TRINITY_DN15827_c1_g1_i10.p3  ORF type:complete len:118 (-),score=37.32 TRINITY_DN15827_c1_g1_i10:168-521(-)
MEALEEQSVESLVWRAANACKAAKFCKESMQDVKDAKKVVSKPKVFVAIVERIRQCLQAIEAEFLLGGSAEMPQPAASHRHLTRRRRTPEAAAEYLLRLTRPWKQVNFDIGCWTCRA